MSNYDIIDLKDQIKKLKATKAQLEAEKAQMEEETPKREQLLTQLRHEYNLAAPTDEIRFTFDESESASGNVIDNKRFRLWNNKIDMMIMCNEIRASLPSLEAEVAKYESRVRDSMKTAKKSEKREAEFPPVLLKSTAELEELVGQQFDVRFDLKAKIATEVEELKAQKQKISNDISSFRVYLAQLWDEKELLMTNSNTIDNAVMQEQIQLEILKKQHLELREAFKKYHNGKGWEAEAFLSVGGTLDATVPIGKLPRVLSQWILCKNRDMVTPEYLQNELKTIASLDYQLHPEHRRNDDHELYALSDDEDELKVIANNDRSGGSRGKSSSEGAAASTGVDFVSFCKLCDRLIILHES